MAIRYGLRLSCSTSCFIGSSCIISSRCPLRASDSIVKSAYPRRTQRHAVAVAVASASVSASAVAVAVVAWSEKSANRLDRTQVNLNTANDSVQKLRDEVDEFGDWRNMISSLFMWVTVIMSFIKPIPASCVYNMDDTTVFLEQMFGRRGKRTHVSKEVKDDLRARLLSFSFGVSKSKRDKRRKKAANTQARTVKILLCTCGDGTVACYVIKMKGEAISTFKLQRVNDNLFIVYLTQNSQVRFERASRAQGNPLETNGGHHGTCNSTCNHF